uniref:LysE family translocator n=1 Tax=Vibrio cholerae TaxID=666 RepID=UPI003080618B
MIDVSVLPVYLTAVLALLLIPGPDMLLIASSSMSYGRRVGLFASLGNATSGMILTLLAALGVSALIAMNPLALNVLHLLGGAYLLKMAWDCLRADAAQAPTLDEAQAVAKTFYQRALVSNLLNPKALVFFVLVSAKTLIVDQRATKHANQSHQQQIKQQAAHIQYHTQREH